MQCLNGWWRCWQRVHLSKSSLTVHSFCLPSCVWDCETHLCFGNYSNHVNLIRYKGSDWVFMLLHLGWWSCLVNLCRRGWFLVQDFTCRWTLNQHTLYSKMERHGLKGKHQGKHKQKLLSILTHLENLCYQTGTLTKQFCQLYWFWLFGVEF